MTSTQDPYTQWTELTDAEITPDNVHTGLRVLKDDLWVAAADLAQAFYHLRLPPSHIFAPDLHCGTALRFAALCVL